MTIKRKRVITAWSCSRLNRIIEVSPVAVMHINHGWLCDCLVGRGLYKKPVWTFGDDYVHSPVCFGFRSVYYPSRR